MADSPLPFPSGMRMHSHQPRAGLGKIVPNGREVNACFARPAKFSGY